MDARSEQFLSEVHPDLARVVRAAAERSPTTFKVIEGRRSVERQLQLMRNGHSLIQDPETGRHVTGHAVDLAILLPTGAVTWEAAAYRALAPVLLQAAQELGVAMRWGGSFARLFDGVHFELCSKTYPGVARTSP